MHSQYIDVTVLVLIDRRVFPNAVGKVSGSTTKLSGQEIMDVKDVSSLSLKRPVDRGYVIHWDLQKEIWSHGLKRVVAQYKGQVEGIVVSEPYMNLPSMHEEAKRILRDEMKFQSVAMLYPATMALLYMAQSKAATEKSMAMHAGAGLVIDIGFSFTHIVPIFDWHPIKSAIKRIDLGGKALTNYMKELVSFRSMNMMKETNLMEHIREELCFVSENVEEDLQKSKGKNSPFRVEWFLPDGVTSTWGYIRDQSQPRGPKDPILVVNNERFMVPELLFSPSDIGMEEAGLAEACVQAVGETHPNIHGLLYSNVLVIGGMAKCPGLQSRLYSELRPLVPDDYDVTIEVPEKPDTVAWQGGALIGSSPQLFAHFQNNNA